MSLLVEIGIVAVVVAVAFRVADISDAHRRGFARTLQRRNDPKRAEAVLPLLDRCMDLLVAEYGAETFTPPQLSEPPVASDDPRLRIQQVIQVAGARWQVTPPSIHLTLVAEDARSRFAGQIIEPARGGGLRPRSDERVVPAPAAWTIAVNPRYLQDDIALSVIVAHEFAHGVLHRDLVSMGDSATDEVLTDVAAALSGFGGLMLRLQERVRRHSVGVFRQRIEVGGPGYLWPPELRYVLARHARLSTEVEL